MRVPRLLLPGLVPDGDSVLLDADSSHYLARVLRRRPGDPLLLGDGDGRLWHARVADTDGRGTRVQLEAKAAQDSESGLQTHLGVALLRGDRMDYALQKACELGVDRISLLQTERVEVKLTEKRLNNRMAHYQGVLQHAAQQSGRSRIPALQAPVALADWAAQPSATGDWQRLVLDPGGPAPSPTSAPPAGVVLVTGPEGGLTETEIGQLQGAGFLPTRLGPRVLRAETAPVVGLTVLQWLYGDLALPPTSTPD